MYGGFKFFEAAIKDAAAEEKALQSLQKAIDVTGQAWKGHRKSLKDTLNDMEEATGVGLPELSQALLRLTTATGSIEKGFKDLSIAMDVSVARHTGLAQAAVILAKAEGGNDTALRRLGIILPKITKNVDELKKRHDDIVASGGKFTASQKQIYENSLVTAAALDKEATRTNILSELQRRFGGQTAVFAASAAGQYARLREAIKNVMEEIGGAMLPGLAKAAEGLRGWVVQLRQSEQFHETLRGTIGALGTVFHSVGLAIQTAAPALQLFARAAADVARVAGAGGILAAAAAYKSVTIAIGAATAIQAKYATTLKGSVGAEAEAAAVEQAYTAALEANTIALEANVVALRAHALSIGADVAAMEAALAGIGLTSAKAATSVEEVGVSAAKTGGLLALLGAGLRSLISPQTAIAIGAAGLAFGIYKLVTRESDWDRANDRVKGSIEGLRGALINLHVEEEKLSRLKLEIPTLKAAVAQAKLAVETDRAALATSSAGHQTLEYRNLQAQLASDTAALHTVEADLFSTRSQAAQSARKVASDQQKVVKAREEELASLTALGDKQRKQDQEAAGRLGRVAKDSALARAQEEQARQRATVSVDKYTQAVLKDADAQKNQQFPQLVRNLKLLAQYAQAIGQIPTRRQTDVILHVRGHEDLLQLIYDLRALRGEAESVGQATFESPRAGAAATRGAEAFKRNTTAVTTAVGHTADEASARIGAHMVAYGKTVSDSVTGAADSVRSAQETLATTIKEGQQAIADSITSAKQNLNTIGQSLADAINNYIDKVTNATDRTSGTAVGLTKKAKAELAELQREIAAGVSSPELEARSKALQSQLGEQASQTGSTTAADARKERVKRELADLTDLYNKHAISRETLEKKVTAILRREGITRANIRKRLGIAAADEFTALLKGLGAQATALRAGPQAPGTGLAVAIVRPLEALRVAQHNDLEARKALADTQNALTKAEIEQQKLLTEELKKFRAKLRTEGFTKQQTQGKAIGGAVSGPAGTDTVPAMLTAGEIVLNAGQQQNLRGMLGVRGGGPSDLFAHVKRGGAQRFAEGGVARRIPLGPVGSPGVTPAIDHRGRRDYRWRDHDRTHVPMQRDIHDWARAHMGRGVSPAAGRAGADWWGEQWPSQQRFGVGGFVKSAISKAWNFAKTSQSRQRRHEFEFGLARQLSPDLGWDLSLSIAQQAWVDQNKKKGLRFAHGGVTTGGTAGKTYVPPGGVPLGLVDIPHVTSNLDHTAPHLYRWKNVNPGHNDAVPMRRNLEGWFTERTGGGATLAGALAAAEWWKKRWPTQRKFQAGGVVDRFHHDRGGPGERLLRPAVNRTREAALRLIRAYESDPTPPTRFGPGFNWHTAGNIILGLAGIEPGVVRQRLRGNFSALGPGGRPLQPGEILGGAAVPGRTGFLREVNEWAQGAKAIERERLHRDIAESQERHERADTAVSRFVDDPAIFEPRGAALAQYRARGLSPEAARRALRLERRERARIAKEVPFGYDPKKFAAAEIARQKTDRAHFLPPGVRTARDLEALMEKLDTDLREGLPFARHWYQDSSKEILGAAGGNIDMADKYAALSAIFSPQQAVVPNIGLAERAARQLAQTGEVSGGHPWQKLASKIAWHGGDWRDAVSENALKIRSFYGNLLEGISPRLAKAKGYSGDETTNDGWIAARFGYGTGKALKKGEVLRTSNVSISPAEYHFITRATQQLAKHYGVDPMEAQAGLWVPAKASADKSFAAQYAKGGAPRREALRGAGSSFADGLWKNEHKLRLAFELLSEQKPWAKYLTPGQARRYTSTSGRGLARNISQKLGLPARLVDEGSGYWITPEGKLEINPASAIEIAIGSKAVGKEEGTKSLLKGAAKFRLPDDEAVLAQGIAGTAADVFRQEGVGFLRPIESKGVQSNTTAWRVNLGRAITPKEITAVHAALDKRSLYLSPTGDGFLIARQAPARHLALEGRAKQLSYRRASMSAERAVDAALGEGTWGQLATQGKVQGLTAQGGLAGAKDQASIRAIGKLERSASWRDFVRGLARTQSQTDARYKRLAERNAGHKLALGGVVPGELPLALQGGGVADRFHHRGDTSPLARPVSLARKRGMELIRAYEEHPSVPAKRFGPKFPWHALGKVVTAVTGIDPGIVRERFRGNVFATLGPGGRPLGPGEVAGGTALGRLNPLATEAGEWLSGVSKLNFATNAARGPRLRLLSPGVRDLRSDDIDDLSFGAGSHWTRTRTPGLWWPEREALIMGHPGWIHSEVAQVLGHRFLMPKHMTFNGANDDWLYNIIHATKQVEYWKQGGFQFGGRFEPVDANWTMQGMGRVSPELVRLMQKRHNVKVIQDGPDIPPNPDLPPHKMATGGVAGGDNRAMQLVRAYENMPADGGHFAPVPSLKTLGKAALGIVGIDPGVVKQRLKGRLWQTYGPGGRAMGPGEVAGGAAIPGRLPKGLANILGREAEEYLAFWKVARPRMTKRERSVEDAMRIRRRATGREAEHMHGVESRPELLSLAAAFKAVGDNFPDIASKINPGQRFQALQSFRENFPLPPRPKPGKPDMGDVDINPFKQRLHFDPDEVAGTPPVGAAGQVEFFVDELLRIGRGQAPLVTRARAEAEVAGQVARRFPGLRRPGGVRDITDVKTQNARAAEQAIRAREPSAFGGDQPDWLSSTNLLLGNVQSKQNELRALLKNRFADGGIAEVPKPRGFMAGGLVGGTDTVPAMLTPGELVISRPQRGRLEGGTEIAARQRNRMLEEERKQTQLLARIEQNQRAGDPQVARLAARLHKNVGNDLKIGHAKRAAVDLTEAGVTI